MKYIKEIIDYDDFNWIQDENDEIIWNDIQIGDKVKIEWDVKDPRKKNLIDTGTLIIKKPNILVFKKSHGNHSFARNYYNSGYVKFYRILNEEIDYDDFDWMEDENDNEIKVGDTVTVNNKSLPNHILKSSVGAKLINKKGTVILIKNFINIGTHGIGTGYLVDFGNGLRWWILEKYIKLYLRTYEEIDFDEDDWEWMQEENEFEIGDRVRFKSKDKGGTIPKYYTIGIPSNMIRHGQIHTDKNYEKDCTIVSIYEPYYIVRYKDEYNEYVQLGFKKDVLEKI